MRRFSSEGSLLDLDFLPWKRMALKDPDDGKNRKSGIYTPHIKEDELGGGSGFQTPTILEPRASPTEVGKKGMNKEHSVSVETLSELGKQDKSHLGVCVISANCRAYSDGQLAPANKGSTESMEGDNLTPTSPSATERRSRLVFMRQWSQVGHTPPPLPPPLTAGVSVFGAFLRSEFSEENLQFYLACEQYRHSSNNFSLQRRAKDICTTYIQPGAPREVNLDSKTRELSLQLLQAPSHTSLDHAQKRIYSLLDTDCYPRFL
ncbi:hypothetical protein FQN60_007848, partial [Etheostoma spectabile]